MELQYRMESGRLTAALTGELGHHEALGLMDRLGRLVEAWLPGEMVLDLGGLEFMDSSGIAVVVQTARKCAACGSRFTLCRVPAQAKKVLCAAGIDRLVRIWEEERP